MLIDGIVSNVGMEGDGEASLKRMGGRSGPDDRSVLICFGRLCEAWLGLAGLDVWRFEVAPLLGAAGDEFGSALQHSAAARASVSRPVPLWASTAGREDGAESAARQLHFQTLLQLHGFNRESTVPIH